MLTGYVLQCIQVFVCAGAAAVTLDVYQPYLKTERKMNVSTQEERKDIVAA